MSLVNFPKKATLAPSWMSEYFACYFSHLRFLSPLPFRKRKRFYPCMFTAGNKPQLMHAHALKKAGRPEKEILPTHSGGELVQSCHHSISPNCRSPPSQPSPLHLPHPCTAFVGSPCHRRLHRWPPRHHHSVMPCHHLHAPISCVH